MRVGLVNPYSFDVPGGVQLHVRDLAEHLLGVGHEVSVLTPAEGDTPLPPYAVNAGSAVPVRYNGSVARLAFGPIVNRRVERWLEDGDFDVVHIHEPAVPSTSVLALWAVKGVPVVGTFHSQMRRSRVLRTAGPLVRPGLDKITARIAVSEDARHTVRQMLGGDAMVVPNGVYVDRFRPREPAGAATARPPTVAFLGRFDEPRKGLPVLIQAVPPIRRAVPDVRVLVAGPGDVADVAKELPDDVASCVRFLGLLDHDEKVAFLAGADVYVAPNTGGESFGVILVEAMAAGAAVVASDLSAFTAVLGRPPAGEVFPVGDHHVLAERIVTLLRDPQRRDRLRTAGMARAAVFDWSSVGSRIEAVYDSVTPSVPRPRAAGAAKLLPSRWRAERSAR